MISSAGSVFAEVTTLVVKVTHRCNLACRYCYEHIVRGPDMSPETFRALIDPVMTQTRKDRVHILFHGGEPTLMDDAWYVLAVAYARHKAVIGGKRVTFSLQTNLIALKDSQIDLFHDLGIAVSVSLDGPFSDGTPDRPRHDRALENFLRLRRKGVQAGILMTINPSNARFFPQILDGLYHDLDIRHFKANPVYAVGAGRHLPDLTADQIFQAQKAMLEHLITTQGQGAIEDNVALELRRFFAENTGPELCRQPQCGAGRRVLGITTQGDILPCGRFEWDDHEYRLGTIHDEFPVRFQAKRDDFHREAPENRTECASCEARDICSYGCQAFIVRSKSRINIECEPTRLRYRYMVENREKLEPVYRVIAGRMERRRNR